MIMAANPAMLPPPLPSHCRPPATLLWSEGHPSSTRGLPAPRLGLGHHLNPLFHHWNHCCSTTCYTTQLGLFQHHLRALQHSLWIRGHASSPGELLTPRLSLDNHHNTTGTTTAVPPLTAASRTSCWRSGRSSTTKSRSALPRCYPYGTISTSTAAGSGRLGRGATSQCENHLGGTDFRGGFGQGPLRARHSAPTSVVRRGWTRALVQGHHPTLRSPP